MGNLTLLIFLFSAFITTVLLAYPIYAYLKAVFINKPIEKLDSFVIPVSIIIASYNEENLIRDKINFFLSEKEWIQGSEIIVVSAGSTDGTNSILEEFNHLSHFKSIIIKEHLVKPLALNKAVAEAKNNILIFSDCRQIIKSGSVKTLVAFFNDSNIGIVNSTIYDRNKKGKSSIIRSILNSICMNESVSGSSLNVHGALYAQRKSVFAEFPDDILFDDLFAIISTLGQNKRIIQTNEIIITDIPIEIYYNKNRLERLSRGLLIFLFRYWKEIKKLPKETIVRFLIYRYLKLLLPYLFLGLLIPSIFYIYPIINKNTLMVFMLFILIILLYRPVRNSIMLCLRINYCFMSSTFKYIFLKHRDTKWDKLKPDQTIINS